MLNGFIGNEAILYQASTAKFKEMTKVMQNVIDFRDNLDYSKKGNLTEFEFRDQEIYKYCITTFDKNLKEYCKKNFNLEVKKVYYSTSRNGTAAGRSLMFNFWVSLGMKDIDNVIDQMNRFSGSNNISNIDPNESFMTLVDLFDHKTGYLKSKEYGKGDKLKPIFVDIGFDQVAAFLAKDRLHNTLVSEDFTAEELAAIMLHEIGHLTTIVEHSADMYYRVQRPVQHIEDILKHKDSESIVKIVIPKTKEFINDLVKNKTLDEQTASKMDAVLTGIDYTLRNIDESILMVPMALIVNIIGGILILLIKTLSYFYFGTVFTAINQLYFGTSVGGDKSSDTYNTGRNYYHVERLSDEFVSRLGAGGHLASGLGKLQTMMQVAEISVTDFPSQRLNRSTLFSLYLVTLINLCKIVNVGGPIGNYEENKARIKRIIQNNMQVFKNNLPKEMADHYIRDTEKAYAEYEKLQPTFKTLSKTLDFIGSYFPLTSPGTFLLRLTTGNITNEMEKLLNDIESIINTRLNYHGVKFAQLARQKTGNESFDLMLRTDTWKALIEYLDNDLVILNI